MKYMHLCKISFLSFLLVLPMITVAAAAEKFTISLNQCSGAKSFFDDPRPFLKDLGPDKVLPPEDYAKLVFDVDTMKKSWAEVIGFKAPDVVGKIALEIKPGKYSYQDKDKYPGLKELFIPLFWERFNPGGPPHCGNFPEIEVVPTKQYYLALPIAEATKKYAGTTKQDEQGYINYGTYQAGLSFPRPSGPHKAIQILYNWEKRYLCSDSYMFVQSCRGFNKNLNQDFSSENLAYFLRLAGRTIIPPYGWYDERAQKRRELKALLWDQLSPRDSYVTFSTFP